MKRVWMLCLVASALAVPARAAEETVSFKSGADTASGLLVTPAGKGPFPAVVVIQEWWGLNDWVKDQARALAKRVTSPSPWTCTMARSRRTRRTPTSS